MVNFYENIASCLYLLIIFLQIQDCTRKPWVVFNPKMHSCTSHPCIKTRVDAINVYYHLSRIRRWQAWSNLCTCGVTAIFQPIYLWKPLKENIETQLKINASKGFFHMFASLWLYALHVEELPSWMARVISKQRWKEAHNFGGNCGPISLDLTYNFWAIVWK